MPELKTILKIEEREGINTVNAKKLYEFLEIKTRFNDWIRNYTKDFKLDVDYLTLTKNLVNGGASKEYYLTPNMAKKLGMLARSKKGNEVRQYFLDIEEEYKKQFVVPDTFAGALKLAYEQQLQIEKQTLELESNKPKVEFFDTVIGADTLTDMGKVAKVISNEQGIKIGRNKLFEFLKSKSILQKTNIPYQQYIDAGYFKLQLQKFYAGSELRTSYKTLVYTKGIDYIVKLLNKE